MRSQTISQAFAMTTAAAAAALLLTACGPSQPQSQTTTAPATGQASQSPSPSASTAPPASSAPASTSPESPAPGTTAGAPALCKAAGLTAATDASGGGAAGSVYMKLTLTNKGTDPCLLRGFSGVSLVADPTGAPIGAAATRDESAPVVDVLLAPGQAGTAVLRYTQAGNYTDCSPVDATGYRVYPPEDTDSLFLPQPTKACSNAQITLLTIGAFQPS